jgi:hypothetical protein
MTDPAPQPDHRKVRIGLAMVLVAFVVALVIFLVADAAFVRALMAAIAVLALVRAYLLTRSLRSDPGAGA